MDAIDRFNATAPVSVPAAIHEAGHAVARWWCGVPLRFVAALPDGSGITANTDLIVRSVGAARNGSEFHRLAVVALAGAVTEAMFTGVDVGLLLLDQAAYDAARVDVAAQRLFLPGDVEHAKHSAMRSTALVLAQPRVLGLVAAVSGLLLRRRAIRGDTVLTLLNDTMGEAYPRRRRDEILFCR